MNPDRNDLWFLPLGGCGEIGMNMNLYGHDEQWLMVDCGVTFRDADGSNHSGYHMQMADPTFISTRRDQLCGIVLTHAHEDHIGALPWLWPQLKCPVYTNEFTAEMLRRKLVEHGLDGIVPIQIVRAGDRFDVGSFNIEWVANTHSVPDPCGLVLRTPAGSLFHTADWKLDPEPLVGHEFRPDHYQAIGDSGIDAMVCDSTCANVSGRSRSEASLHDGLLELVREATGRVVVACFGSNIARLSTLARIALATDRDLGLLGRSLIETVSAARTVGLWSHPRTLVDAAHLGYLPPDRLLLVATGSQAEPRTALNRLSQDRFRQLSLERGDLVIFSARAIPGNEAGIDAMIERLEQRGIQVITPERTDLAIHASGHPATEELADLYRWIRPGLMIPVHGEAEHMSAQVSLARANGIQRQLSGQNGDLFVIAPNTSIRRKAVGAPRLGVDQRGKLQSIG